MDVPGIGTARSDSSYPGPSHDGPSYHAMIGVEWGHGHPTPTGSANTRLAQPHSAAARAAAARPQDRRGARGGNRAAPQHRARTPARRQLPIRDLQQSHSAAELQLELLDDHMVQCGFDTEMDSEATATAPRMTMHDCPYADIARQDPQVCAVHFTLVQAALHRVDGPVTARALHPFSGPSACTVDLTIGDPVDDTGPR